MSDLLFVRTPHGLEMAQKATEGLVPVTLKAPTENRNPDTGIPVSEMDNGPWTVIDYPHNTNVGVHSAEPVHRARLRIYGNFETNEEKVEYAKRLAERLNARSVPELEAENKRQADWMGEARELLTKAWFPIKPLDDRRDALLEGDTGIPASEGE